MIERDLPGAGDLSADDLKSISQKSCAVLSDLGPDIEWDHSYVTQDKICCVYRAADEAIIREHAERGGFPCNAVREIGTIISPATAG